MTTSEWRTTLVRWLKFNVVGGIGIVVQLLFLGLFKSILQMNYLIATALAVEAAVIHNFVWHERFTWVDRCTQHVATRFLKFNLTTGALSILGNLALMRLGVGTFGLNYLTANVLAIAICSMANFLVSDRFVFLASAAD